MDRKIGLGDMVKEKEEKRVETDSESKDNEGMEKERFGLIAEIE